MFKRGKIVKPEFPKKDKKQRFTATICAHDIHVAQVNITETAVTIVFDASATPNCVLRNESLDTSIFAEEQSKRNDRIGKHMENRNFQMNSNSVTYLSINLLSAAKYLISLYYSTTEKYQCTRTKIEKLLSIAQLVANRNGVILFNKDICINSCGTGFPSLSNFIFSEIINGEEDSAPISEAILSATPLREIPELYKMTSNDYIEENVKSLLQNVFLTFGRYNCYTIGELLDGFKQDIQASSRMEYGRPVVDLDIARSFFNDEMMLNEFKNNIVFMYIARTQFSGNRGFQE